MTALLQDVSTPAFLSGSNMQEKLSYKLAMYLLFEINKLLLLLLLMSDGSCLALLTNDISQALLPVSSCPALLTAGSSPTLQQDGNLDCAGRICYPSPSDQPMIATSALQLAD